MGDLIDRSAFFWEKKATNMIANEGWHEPATLEQQAIEIMNVALLEDTAPAEYVAPKDDPA